MKVAIASDDGKTIADHFGRTLGFVIYDISGKGEIVGKNYHQNNHTQHVQGHGHQHGHHHEHGHEHGHGAEHGHGPVLSLLGGVQVVICRGMGRRILMDLNQAGIQPFIVNVDEVEDAIQKFLSDQLENDLSRQCQH